MKWELFYSRMHWLVVPEVVYLTLLFGSWAVMVISVVMSIVCCLRKRDKQRIVKWIVILLVALLISILTMTGKIVPNTAFGG